MAKETKDTKDNTRQAAATAGTGEKSSAPAVKQQTLADINPSLAKEYKLNGIKNPDAIFRCMKSGWKIDLSTLTLEDANKLFAKGVFWLEKISSK